MTTSNDEEVLLDVTRLIWRRWRGGLPTGVDRVCLAYLDHFGSRARAVVQRKGVQLVLSHRRSQQLFQLLQSGKPGFRWRQLLFWLTALPNSRPPAGALYLNVGHTGLDEPALPDWIARHHLRAVYLIHDLIPITHPHFCRAGEDRKHERRMRNALVSASGLIANSGSTADAVRSFAGRVGLPVPPMVVAWLSGNALRRAPASIGIEKPYFLALGTIEARKNHQLLLDVWRKLVERLSEAAPRLVIVGTRGWKADEVFRQLDDLGPLEGHVEERSRCSDGELAALMAGARALLMPSHTEGYGMPVFEALELGTPVIAADLSVYHEVAGAIPEYLPPDDVEAWVTGVQLYLQSGPNRSAQLERLKGFRVPDWTSHFARVEEWLKDLDATD